MSCSVLLVVDEAMDRLIQEITLIHEQQTPHTPEFFDRLPAKENEYVVSKTSSYLLSHFTRIYFVDCQSDFITLTCSYDLRLTGKQVAEYLLCLQPMRDGQCIGRPAICFVMFNRVTGCTWSLPIDIDR